MRISELQDRLRTSLARLWGAQVSYELSAMGGDASTRSYYRVHVPGDDSKSLVVMVLGRNPRQSEEITSSAVEPEELPFIEIQRYLLAGKIPVPKIYEDLSQDGLILLEDLGDETLERRVLVADEADCWLLYCQAIDLLVAMQRFASAEDSGQPVSARCICLRRRFDYALLRWELDHFKEWLLEAERGVSLNAHENDIISSEFDRLARLLADMPTTWIHRDYQSRNLMVDASDGVERLRIIDFQDALVGPALYDVVGLLRDSYVDLGLPLMDRLLDYYFEQDGGLLDATSGRRYFWLQCVQRKLKDAGRFVFLARERGKSGYLPDIPLSLRYVGQALVRLPEFSRLREVLGRHLPELRSRPTM